MGLSSLRRWRNLVGTKHSCCFRGKSIPVEPSSTETRVEVDDGQRDEQDESAGQPEELRRVLAARQPTELAVFGPSCEVCVKAKGTGAQHRRQTNKELAKQEQYGRRIYSDLFYISEGGVLTPMLALKYSAGQAEWLPHRWSRKD